MTGVSYEKNNLKKVSLSKSDNQKIIVSCHIYILSKMLTLNMSGYRGQKVVKEKLAEDPFIVVIVNHRAY